MLRFLFSRLFVVAFFCLPAFTATAQNNLFLKLPGLEGESIDKGHKGWIDIYSCTQSLSSATSAAGGTQVAGRTKFDEFVIEKKLDKASPRMLGAAASGQRFADGVIEVCKFDGRENRVFLVIRLTDVIISGHQFGISEQGSDPGKEQLKLSFSGISWEYKVPPPSTETVKDGWDLRRNQRIQ